MISLASIDTIAKAYAAHNRIHAEYVDARWGQRRKASMQEDHEGVVRKLLELGGKHLSKGEALDDTLPQELRGAFKARYLSTNIILVEGEPATSTPQVLRTGTFYHPHYGKFTITVADLENMLANFTSKRPKAPTEMVVDFEHMSVADPPVVAPAAGWVKGLKVEGEALFATVEWTEDAADKIRKKEYRFISPEFSLNYRDKESGKSIGATLVAVALTNRPFLEGMLPVVLSEELAEVLTLSETTLEGINALVSEDNTYVLAEWTTQYIDTLPDSCFAYVKSGGEKDADGNTVPRALRFLPYKDADGEVDPAQLRTALASLPEADLTSEEQTTAKAALTKAAKGAGIEDAGTEAKSTKEGASIMGDAELRKLLGLAEDANIADGIVALQAKAKDATDTGSKLTTETERANVAELKLNEQEADVVVATALTDKKILPKQAEWAKQYCLTDRAGFDAYIEAAAPVGPEEGEKGSGHSTKETITATERKIAKKLGVKEEALQAQKDRDAEAAAAEEE